MNINWAGKQEFLEPKQKETLDAKLGRISKLLDSGGNGDKHARVAFTHDRNMHHAEITLNHLHHTLVGEHVDVDQFVALSVAIDKLERNLIKVREKQRDGKKGQRENWDKSVAASAVKDAPVPESTSPIAEPSSNSKPKVFHVGPEEGKPLTVEEALLEIDSDPYMVYRSVETNRPAVLMRRPDGNFDLVEC